MYCTLLYFVLYCTCIGDLTASILLTLVITDLSCHWTRYNLLNYILTLHSLAAVQALWWSPSAGATKGRGETGAKSRTSSGGTYILYCTVLYYTLYYTVLYYTVLHCTVPYCTVLYCTSVLNLTASSGLAGVLALLRVGIRACMETSGQTYYNSDECWSNKCIS